MIQRIKQILTSLLVASVLFAPLAVPAMASASSSPPCTGTTANIQGCLKTGACLSTDANTCSQASNPNGAVNNIITTVINIFSLLVGVIAVIMIIYGGIRFILSGGDSGNVSSARNTIIYAIVGLIIVALAQIIVHFVLARVTG